MKISFYSIGKPNDSLIAAAIQDFTERIKKYFKVEWKIIAPIKNAAQMSEAELKKKEATIVMDMLGKDDYLVALDENGKQLSSEGLANFVQGRANESVKHLIFLIGGAFGIDELLLKRANYTWSLSQLTFPHQLVRLLLAEQFYRACSILKNEKYHHK